MLHVSAVDRVGGAQKSLSVHATQARLTPHEIAEARERLPEIDLAPPAEYLNANGNQPMIDEETQALINRARTVLDSGSLTEAQSDELANLIQGVFDATTQNELDELAEALLDMLFDLE
jgi:hypothetical protein